MRGKAITLTFDHADSAQSLAVAHLGTRARVDVAGDFVRIVLAYRVLSTRAMPYGSPLDEGDVKALRSTTTSGAGHESLSVVGVIACVSVLTLHLGAVLDTVLSRTPSIWPMHNDTIHRWGRGVDFYSIYHAAIQIERGLSPYSMERDGITPYFYPFRYLPVVGHASRVFTQLAPLHAYYAWIVVLELMLALVVYALHRRLSSRVSWLLVSSLLLLSSPYLLEIYVGQFTFVATALCALALLAAPRFAALPFALSVLLKSFPLVIAPALVRRRSYWPSVLLAAGAVVALSTRYFLAHVPDFHEFVDANFRPRWGMDAGNHGFMYTLHLLAQDLAMPRLLEKWTAVATNLRWIMLVSTALLVLCSRVDCPVRGACAMGLAHFVSYLHVWEHHLSAVMLLGALLLVAQQARRFDVILILVCLLVLALPTPFALFDVHKDPGVWDPATQWPRYASYLTALPKVLPTLALFALTLVRLAQGGFTSAPWRAKPVPTLA